MNQGVVHVSDQSPDEQILRWSSDSTASLGVVQTHETGKGQPGGESIQTAGEQTGDFTGTKAIREQKRQGPSLPISK